ncbi:MAG: NUDIX hydrolase [Candidatus Oleimicrobiaceae bacterium]
MDHRQPLQAVYPPTPLVGVAVLVEHQGAVLLVRRASAPNAGQWSLPGGRVELGEPVREAARREVIEECGVDVEVLDLIDVCDYIEHDEEGKVRFHYVLVDFRGRYRSGTVCAGSDAGQAAWVPVDELGQYHLTRTTRPLLEKALTQKP